MCAGSAGRGARGMPSRSSRRPNAVAQAWPIAAEGFLHHRGVACPCGSLLSRNGAKSLGRLGRLAGGTQRPAAPAAVPFTLKAGGLRPASATHRGRPHPPAWLTFNRVSSIRCAPLLQQRCRCFPARITGPVGTCTCHEAIGGGFPHSPHDEHPPQRKAGTASPGRCGTRARACPAGHRDARP